MRISDWSSDVCSSDLQARARPGRTGVRSGGEHGGAVIGRYRGRRPAGPIPQQGGAVTTAGPTERVADLLLAAKYKRMPLPLQVAGLDFDVAGAFVAVGHFAALVVIGDMAAQGERDRKSTRLNSRH